MSVREDRKTEMTSEKPVKAKKTADPLESERAKSVAADRKVKSLQSQVRELSKQVATLAAANVRLRDQLGSALDAHEATKGRLALANAESDRLASLDRNFEALNAELLALSPVQQAYHDAVSKYLLAEDLRKQAETDVVMVKYENERLRGEIETSRRKIPELESALKTEMDKHHHLTITAENDIQSLRSENDHLRTELEARAVYEGTDDVVPAGRGDGVSVADLLAALPAGHGVTFTAPDWKDAPADEGGDLWTVTRKHS